MERMCIVLDTFAILLHGTRSRVYVMPSTAAGVQLKYGDILLPSPFSTTFNTPTTNTLVIVLPCGFNTVLNLVQSY
jgi:hypothetical protein